MFELMEEEKRRWGNRYAFVFDKQDRYRLDQVEEVKGYE
jgi:hypothetical protein